MPESQDLKTQTNPTTHPKTITLDVETTGLDWKTDKILLCGYRIDEKEILYAEGKDEGLAVLLSDRNNILRGHNIKFDALCLAQAGYDINCKLEDTRVMAYLSWPTDESHSLKELVRTKLRGSPTELSSLLFHPLKRELQFLLQHADEYWQIDGKWVRKDLLREYHREDILNVDRLRKLMEPTEWFTDVEVPLTRMLFEMELQGCHLDLPRLRELEVRLTRESQELFNRLGVEKPNSTAQVGEKLKELGYDLEQICEKTDKGAYQIDAACLRKLVWKGDKWAEDLLSYKRLTKILGTYVTPFLNDSRVDGRLHGSFNQAGSEDQYGDGSRGTHTGRLSSSSPNLQNIPSRTEIGREVRKCFTATPGKPLFDSDLRQIEPRAIGHYSQSPKLINAYKLGLDTHGLFASDIFGKPIPELTPSERFIGKTSWLATVYGCSASKLLFICEAQSGQPLDAGIYRGYAGVFATLPKHRPSYGYWGDTQDKLLAEFGADAPIIAAKRAFFTNVQAEFKRKNPEIMGWREAHIARTRRLGYVVTFGGRIIKIEGLDSSDRRAKMRAEREAVNYQIQGSSADIMKLIMIQLQDRLVTPRFGNIFAVIHDEVLGELEQPEYLRIVKDCMENTVWLRNIPVESDTKIIQNWGQKS